MRRRPIDLATRETAAFVASHLQLGAEILEIGCGEGDVAGTLQTRGYHVIGVDTDIQALAGARAKGVPAVLARWPRFSSAPVDAIAFTRSLHHVSPLHDAVGRARELLRPAGRLLVEEFAVEEADAGALAWFLDLLHSAAARSLIEERPGQLVTELLHTADVAVAWQRSHDHELHRLSTMTGAITEHFVLRDIRHVPYLYRYLVPVLPETPAALAFLEDVFGEESNLGERGQLQLIGRRFVATLD